MRFLNISQFRQLKFFLKRGEGDGEDTKFFGDFFSKFHI